MTTEVRAPDQVTLRRRGTGVTAYDPSASAGGYTLIPPQTDDGNVYLIDMEGRIAHRWKLPVRPGRGAQLLPNGNLGFNGNHPDTPSHYGAWSLWHGGLFMEVTPEGKTVWQYEDKLHHHDAQWLAGGNLLYAAMEKMPEASVARVQGGAPSRSLAPNEMYGDVIKEVNRKGELVWSWRAWEHLDIESFPVHPIFERGHWPLINGVFSARNGIVLMSLRTTSGVIGVERSSGAVKFRIPYGTVTQQHSPVELANGNILIFDNGNLRPGISTTFSRVIEVNPATGAIEWSYADEMPAAFFSPYMGSAQRLPNGNTHVTESATGRLFEVTREGRVAWEYVIPFFAPYPDKNTQTYVPGHHNSVFKSFRYTAGEIPWLGA